ncbi:phospholipase [Arthrobacter sp. TPD3018]|uniref:phospholipase D-like domain-containing protein n=1 Tax=Bacteria TaxID=2 RepID=UPI000D50FCAD|nr:MULTISPECIES: phospholipase D-like domain-containing protein [Bacteria]PVE54518.1 phospholipase [Sphingomonas sp. TPD3009]PVE54752.1 phospholipase [Arthrobacter sp. TPD3018]PVE82663.1 phospholipase [Sphingomonas melonis]
MLEPDRNVWRIERANRLSVIVDADRYFGVAREAFAAAQKRIMLVGWDFDARIPLVGDGVDVDGPETVGDFLYWLVERNPELELYLLRWDIGALKSIFRGKTLFTVWKWARHPRIHVKLDAHHPTGSSHHQKIVSIDDCLAFCGGIDMTAERWDTRAHRDDDPGRRLPGGGLYKPWHDATTAITGPAAAALAELCRNRWRLATTHRLAPVEGAVSCWPESLAPTFEDVDVGIARSQPEMPGEAPVTEVEALFLDQIRAARRHIYCESQYFASRRIAEAIAARLDEEDGPEIVIVNPLTAQGWLEPIAMDTARARLVETLRRRDRHGRLRLYHPFTQGGTAIYCHAKITIIDDTQLRIGSANINNRSLRLDTECDVVVDAARHPGRGLEATIADARADLMAEHLGVSPAKVAATIAETGSLIATIEQLRGSGRSLRPYEVPDLDGVQEWLADNEVLDPEGPGEMFEATTHRGLFRGRLKRG